MIRSTLIAALTLAAAAPAAPALGQAAGAEPGAGGDAQAAAGAEETIVVTGRGMDRLSLREVVREFVVEVGDPVSSQNGYARWDDRVCVGVQDVSDVPSVPEDAAQYVADRVSDIAQDVGLSTGTSGCEPNITIIFTPDGAGLASFLVEERPLLFRPFAGEGGSTQGLDALDAFATSDAPVRWWQITVVVDQAGNVAMRLPNTMQTVTGPRAVRGIDSHIIGPRRDALTSSYVIVDTSKLAGVTWAQLADYLAMVSLAQVAPEASAAGYDSILNLFDSRSPPAGVTDWDRIYLHALYDLDRHLLPQAQQGALVTLITREQARAGEGD